VVTPIGIGVQSFWQALLAGRSGVRQIQSFSTDGFPVRIAAEVRDFQPEDFVDNRKSLRIMGRNITFAVAAAKLALEDAAGATRSLDPTRFGVTIGTGMVAANLEELSRAIAHSLDQQGQFDLQRFGREGMGQLFPLWLLKRLPNMVAAHLSIIYNIQGPNNTIVTACTAGTQAVAEALRLIQREEADVVLTGGSDSRIDPLNLMSYHLLGALSQRSSPPESASRPFDRGRDGFVLGEGAAVMVLESERHALRRGARIYAEVAGAASSFDAHSVTGPEPSGRGAADCMRRALADAGCTADQVGYISAHGTSTILNDAAETRAIKTAFGPRASRVPVSSIKSMVGHLIGAAGALEAAASALAISERALPPTINYETPDPECDLDYVPNKARQLTPGIVLSNSFGFGGQNAALVLREWSG
jgi:3-oxoacyl-[acyl-carrier-protein] synthase II